MEGNISFENLSLDNLKTIMVRIYKGSSQQEVAEATRFLNAYGKTIQSVPVFVQIMTQDSVSELRLLSAILLKKHIAPHLLTMGADDANLLKNGLLNRFFEEPQRRVQKSIAVLISVIVKIFSEQRQPWTDPLVAISQKTKADHPEEVRIQGFLLLSTLLEFSGKYLSNFYEDLSKFFFESIRDSSSTIRKQTLLCVLNMYSSIAQEELISSFNDIYPLLLECFYQSLQEKDEDTIESVLEMFYGLTATKNALFDNSKINKFMELLCTSEGLLSKDLNPLFRETMIDIIQNITVNYKTVISKNLEVLNKIVEIVFALACLKESPEEVQERDSIQDVALYYIRDMAVLLPKKKSYPIFKEYIQKMFSSNNDDVIEGAFYILGHLSEGCSEYFRRDLNEIINNYIQKGLESPNQSIKKATFNAINFFANYLVPEVIAFHQIILPPLIRNLNDTSDQKNLKSNVVSIEIFCQEMDENIMTYLPEVIPRLIRLIDQPENIIPVKRHSILAISSCAEVAREKFVSYAVELLPLLSQLIGLTDYKFIELKSTSVKCIANIVDRCIKESPQIYTNHIEPLIPRIYEELKTTDDIILREYCFEFFYKLASYLQHNFKPLMPQILEIIYITIENAETVLVEQKPQVISLKNDSDDEDGANDVHLDKEATEELAIAIRCLGEIALACPSEFVQYYEKTTNILSEFYQSHSQNVRMQSLVCYKLMVNSIVKLGNNGEIPKFQKGLPCNQRLPADAEKFLYLEVYERLFQTLEVDDSIQVVITVLEVLYDFCSKLGPAAVDQKLERITIELIKIFSNETTAQTEAFEEDETIHVELFGAATLLIHSLIKVCREGFFPYFDKLYPVLKKLINDETPEDDISEIIGCFAQAIKYMNSASQTYSLDVLDICFKALDYGDEYINRNIAFCIGQIVECAKEKVFEFYPSIMEKLHILYEGATLPDTKDNALAALARMVFINSRQVPLNVVVPAIIKEMPLKGDPQEEKTLIKMLIFLFETNTALLSGLEEKCIELLIDAVIERKSYKIKDEKLIKAIGTILKNLSENQNAKQIIQNCASKLSQENLNILTQLLTTQY